MCVGKIKGEKFNREYIKLLAEKGCGVQCEMG